ncbi:hypothetical protein N7478_005723 [Penicillium angulare]|uniref:uncharacterized protein n=1 Tax=Penicillium angulare TaxID=116970 RepID=UPI002541A2A6|nr:uncharacterized protein N7478_005723 [Penicillium angulare]KAJ5280351.1 hypothetical protein N7478_005723 [Penicillium angulare]
MYAKSILIAALSASIANAHMIMTKPVPYGKDTLNNSPLAADGSDFPCKLRSDTYAVSEQNVMVIGESQPLTFEGSATHGGGSCQISLTTDLTPTKDTDWQVIKSFEGGCPANVDGNLSGGATMVDPYTFNFTIPDGIAAGKYTLAWTWFNRIGNREMYMNCAPVTVQSGSSSKRSEEVEAKPVDKVQKRSSSYPPMFVANVNGCTTSEGVDIRFPQPGDDIEYLGEAANLAKEGSTACTGTATFAGSGDTASGSDSSSSSGSGSDSSSTSTSATQASTATASQAPEPAATTTAAPTSDPAPQPTASSASTVSPASPSSSTSSSTGTLSGSCSPEGEWNCIAGSSFQRCAEGVWSVAQQMASGTECTSGKTSDLTVVASKRARAISELRFRKRALGAPHHA